MLAFLQYKSTNTDTSLCKSTKTAASQILTPAADVLEGVDLCSVERRSSGGVLVNGCLGERIELLAWHDARSSGVSICTCVPGKQVD